MGGGDNSMEVRITGDNSDLESALSTSVGSITGFQKAVAGMGAAMAAVSGYGIAKAVGAASEWNDTVREMAKVTSPEIAKGLDKGIRDMASNIPIATNELGNITAAAARFGVRGKENILSFTETVAKMAAATDLSTDQAGEAFAKLATLTDTPIPKISNLGSAINKLANNMATSASEIVENMMQSSGALSTMGASNTDIVALAGSMNEMYQSASMAGRGLRRLAQEMMDPRKVVDLAASLGMTKDQFVAMRKRDPTGLMVKMAEAMKGGGKSAEGLRKTLTSFSRMALTNMAKNLGSAKKALGMSAKAFDENTSLQKEFQIATQSLTAQIQQLKNAVGNVAITTGRQFIPYVKSAVEYLTAGVSAFDEFNSATNGAAGAITLISGLVAGLLPVLGILVQTVGPTIPLLKGMAVAFSGLSAPIVAVGAVLAGLYVAWQKNLFGIQDITSNVVASIVSWITNLVSAVQRGVSTFGEWWGKMADWLSSEDLVAGIAKITQSFQTGIASWNALLAGNGPKFRSLLSSAIGQARAGVKSGLDGISQVFNAGGVLIQETWAAMFGRLPADAEQFIRSSTVAIGAGLGAILSRIMGFNEQSSSLWAYSMRAGSNAVEAGISLIQRAFAAGLGAVTSRLSAFSTTITNIWRGIFPLLPQPVQNALSKIQTLWNTHVAGALRTARGGYQRVVAGITAIVGTLRAQISKTLTLASALWDRHRAAVTTAATSAYNGAVSRVRTAITSVKSVVRTNLTAALGAWRTHTSGVRTAATSGYQSAVSAIRTRIANVGTSVRKGLLQANAYWANHGTVVKQQATLAYMGAVASIRTQLTNARTAVQTRLGQARKLWTAHGQQVRTAATGAYQSAITAISSRLTAAQTIVRTKLNAVRTYWQQNGQQILTTVQTKYDQVTGFVTGALAMIVSMWRTNGQQILSSARSSYNRVASFISGALSRITGFWNTHSTQIKTVAVAGITAAVGLYIQHISRMAGLVQAGISRIGGIWQRHKTTVSGAVNGVKTALAPYKVTIAGLIPTMLSLGSAGTLTRGKLVSMAGGIASKVMPAVRAFGGYLRGPLLAALRTGTIPAITSLATATGGRLTSSVSRSRGALSKFGGMLVQSGNRVAALRNRFVNLTWQLSGNLRRAVTTVTGRFGSLVTMIGGRLPGPIQRVLGLGRKVASMLGGRLVSALASAGTRFGGLALRVVSLGSKLSLLTNPIGLVIAAVAGLYLAWKKNILGIQDITRNIFNAINALLKGNMNRARNQTAQGANRIKTAFGKIKQIISVARNALNQVLGVFKRVMKFIWKNAVQPAIRGILKLWNENKTQIISSTHELQQVLTTVFKAIAGTLLFIWNNFGDEIQAVAKFAFDTIGSIVGGALDTLITAFDVATDLLTGDWQGALDKMASWAERIFGGIWNYVKKWIGGFLGSIGGLIDSVIGFFEDMYNAIIGNSIIPEMFSAIIGAVGSFISTVIDKFQSFVSDAVGKFTDLKDDAIAAAIDMGKKLVTHVTNMKNNAITKLKKLKSEGVRKLKNMASDAASAAISMGKKLVRHFNNMKDNAITKIQKLARGVMGYLTGRKGPLSNVKKAGKQLIQGFINGIGSKLKAVGKAVHSIVKKARDKLPGSDAKEGPLSDLSATGPALVDMVAKGIEKNKDELARAARNAAAAAKIPISAAMPALDAVALTSSLARRNATRAPTLADAQATGDTYNIKIRANSRAEGKAAAEGFVSVMRSHGFD